MESDLTRRSLLAATAAFCGRGLAANDRIQIGLIGCGSRL